MQKRFVIKSLWRPGEDRYVWYIEDRATKSFDSGPYFVFAVIDKAVKEKNKAAGDDEFLKRFRLNQNA